MTKKVQPLIFLHIPKTAGVTIHFILKRQYFLQRTYNIHTISQTKNFIDLSDAQKLKYKVVKGHMYFGVHEHMPVKSTYFTFLREPYARTISGYHFVRQSKAHPVHKETAENNYSLKEFLELRLVKNFDNMQVRFLAGANDLPFGEVNEAIYEKAKANFDKYFDVFGIVERFDESLLYLQEQFHWSDPYYVRENKSAVNQGFSGLDAETKAIVEETNQYDKRLYDYAFTKFDAIVKARGEKFQEEVRRFRRLNQKFQPYIKLFNRVFYLFLPGSAGLNRN